MTAATNSVPPRRWWLRFTLRLLLALVTVLCVWLAIHTQRARQQRQVIERLRSLPKTSILYDYQFKNGGWRFSGDELAQSKVPGVLTDALGADFFHTVTFVAIEDLRALPELAKLPTLEHVTIWNDDLSDREIAALARINGLREIHVEPTNGRIFATTKIGDGALRTISQLPEIESIFIYGTDFSPEGLAALAEAKTLNAVHVYGCSPNVDQAAVEGLVRSPNIRDLHVVVGTDRQQRDVVYFLDIDVNERLTSLAPSASQPPSP